MVIVAMGVLFSNFRLSDTNGRIDAMQQHLVALIQAESGKLQVGLERV